MTKLHYMHLANFWLPLSTVVVADVTDVDIIDLIPEAIAVYILSQFHAKIHFTHRMYI